jgi:hypothetical protein
MGDRGSWSASWILIFIFPYTGHRRRNWYGGVSRGAGDASTRVRVFITKCTSQCLGCQCCFGDWVAGDNICSSWYKCMQSFARWCLGGSRRVETKVPDETIWKEVRSFASNFEQPKPPDSGTNPPEKPVAANAAVSEELAGKSKRTMKLKAQARKYGQALRSLAKVIAVGPYNKEGDPGEANVMVVRNFVNKIDEFMDTELDEIANFVFPDQIRKEGVERNVHQKQMLASLTQKLNTCDLPSLMLSTWERCDSASDEMQTYQNENEAAILWPGILLENIKSVCQRKESITDAYVKNAKWVEEYRSKRTKDLDVLTKKKLDPGTDPAGKLLIFWVMRKSEIKKQVDSYDKANMEFNVDSESHKSLINGFKTIGIPFDFNECNYKAIFLGQVELYNELLKCFEMQLRMVLLQRLR